MPRTNCHCELRYIHTKIENLIPLDDAEIKETEGLKKRK